MSKQGQTPLSYVVIDMAHIGKDARSYIKYNRNKMRCDEIRNGLDYKQSNHPIGRRKALTIANGRSH